MNQPANPHGRDSSTVHGALSGLRVVDLTGDAGRFATKLLTELGADVVRVGTGAPGLPLADPAAAALGGVADWWYDGGKRRCRVDLSTAEGQDAYRRLADAADMVVETERPGRLADAGIDYPDISTDNPALVQVSITPFGRTGPRAQWLGSDLVAAAMGGMMGLTGLADRPLNVWGRQAYNYAGFVAAASGVAAALSARSTGRGAHLDLSVHETVTGSIENLFMQYFFDDVLPLPKVAPRQGALHWLRAYDLAECVGGDGGYVMITPTPTPDLLLEWMVETGSDEVDKWIGIDPGELLLSVDEVMDAVRRWIAPQDAREVWWEAQERHVAFGGVLGIAEVCANPQFAHREFFADVLPPGRTAANGSLVSARSMDTGTGSAAGSVTLPARLVRWSDTGRSGSVPPGTPAAADTSLEEILALWAAPAGEARNGDIGSVAGAASSGNDADDRRPLDGIRVADFTWVLAGPSATKLLGDLGADVIRIQSEERSTLVNSPDFPYYFVWNRSKRSATLDMKHPDALAAARRLIETCDVLIENFSAGVLDSWGLDWETAHQWNPRLVYVTMSGCGHDGPWRHVISYAPTVHAVCGITHLTNFADRGDVGPGFSLNDHLAGFAAAVSTVGALYARERTGEGQRIDMAQLEVGTYAIGAAIIRQSAGVLPPRPEGNRDGIADHVPNEVYATGDGFVAVTVTEPAQWLGLVGLLADPRLDDPSLVTEAARRDRRSMIDAVLGEWSAGRTAAEAADALQGAGVPAGPVQDSHQLFTDDPQHADRGFWQAVDHAVFGERTVDAFAGLWNGRRWTPRHLSPAYLGEHNFDVWADAGYSPEEIAEGIGDGLFQ
ncbi:CaiB/BaiF CoA-transferase family protein [Candidatus Poriferisodalis multihospitum]|uniref:CaiB/BaiF CoA-transferase family protein n=1 Tax=Candidatus Poriferisodalis multihospitum TaxID=2983191 RepID=UPI002B262A87|nr:CoA transferase [Candidatus Poriferisodalis multihospitum]